MRKKLEEIAFDSGMILRERLKNPPPFIMECFREGILPISDLDIISINTLINNKYYSGEKASDELMMFSASLLGAKYVLLYGLVGNILYDLLKNLIN